MEGGPPVMNERAFNRIVAKKNLRCLEQGWYEADGGKHAFSLSPMERKKAILITPSLCRIYVQHFLRHLSFRTASVTVVPEDSLACPSALVMNFASPVHPGGGYLEGSGAQEECLCRESSLYESLVSPAARPMYEINRRVRDPMESDAMILSPHVEVFRLGRDRDYAFRCPSVKTAVLSVPAPNLLGKAHGQPRALIRETVCRRIRNVLACAAFYGYSSLTLGAWGCGIFGHDPADMAASFDQVLYREQWASLFAGIRFAVYDSPGSMQKNYDAFARQFV